MAIVVDTHGPDYYSNGISGNGNPRVFFAVFAPQYLGTGEGHKSMSTRETVI